MGLTKDEAAAATELHRIGAAWWTLALDADPVAATALGIPGRDHLLPDLSPSGLGMARDRARALLDQLAAVAPALLDDAGRTSHAVLHHELTAFLAPATSEMEVWHLDHIRGPHAQLFSLGQFTRVDTDAARASFVSRVRAMGAFIDQHTANLRSGLARDLVARASQVAHVLRRVRAALSAPVAESPLCRTLPTAEVAEAVREIVHPSLARLADFLADELAPRAREAVGMTALALPDTGYQALIQANTTLSLSPREIHALGVDEVAAVWDALASALGVGADAAPAALRATRAACGVFDSRDAIERAARAAIDRGCASAHAVIPGHALAPIEVVPIPAHAEARAPAGYYRPAPADGSAPGRYFVNTHEPAQRDPLTVEVLAFHEGVPGHHLQTTLAAGLSELPVFQRHSLLLAYAEGWAVYCEALADELGLYSCPEARLGMLVFRAWRVARLVAETGMHALGWSRARARAYLVDAGALPDSDAEREVDRYVAWPGQGLAYWLGARHVRALRQRASAVLGDRFALPGFHERVLGSGPMPLWALTNHIERWAEKPASAR